jgi:preprotein translocase subunit SecE
MLADLADVHWVRRNNTLRTILLVALIVALIAAACAVPANVWHMTLTS